MPFDGSNPCRFEVGDRVKLRSGLQVYRVLDVSYCVQRGDWMVHAKFGPCHFWQWQGEIDRG